ncbi:vWA domain-containing protein [Aquimarina sp. 2201CG5-10]|uniref:vWA domain-containing protein n=1 Tax=Aquimarina callyspongiae TaxID=3098150 RepID=UPI002AB3D4A9|nr:vWA domain-containing protein [Aquimarina sp. 2201CG5-10]MDY8137433.1 vWA domain-containing protein [Aquimarina sp. 2201CG5-10]
MYKRITFYLVILIVFNCIDSKAYSTELRNSDFTELAELVSATTTKNRNVEIVFCLDATGSMSGLIGTAKEKIWDIVSDLAASNDVDTLKMGMIFYRDRGDAFITRQIPLTTDLDSVYADLLEIGAGGGGDSPESVNQALNESVNDMAWSSNENTYRTIFVVGDCPPHMDYKDDVPYTISCTQAAEKGITINTIKLGTDCRSAITHFKKMAACSNGEFLQLDQNATDYVIDTPYDKEINEVSKKIDDSRLYYGNENEQRLNNAKKAKSMEVYDKSSLTANSARASYKMSKSGENSWMGSKEIIKDYKTGKVKLDTVKDDELPTELKGKTITEKEKILKQLLKERESNVTKMKELNKKRKDYLDQKAKERSDTDELSFSKEVIKIMIEQSKSN